MFIMPFYQFNDLVNPAHNGTSTTAAAVLSFVKPSLCTSVKFFKQVLCGTFIVFHIYLELIRTPS